MEWIQKQGKEYDPNADNTLSIRTKINKITNQETQGIKSNTPEHLNKQPSLDITLWKTQEHWAYIQKG